MFSGQIDAAEGVCLMRIKSRGDQNDIGLEKFDSRQDFFSEHFGIGLVVGTCVHWAVEGSPFARTNAGLRI